MTFHEADNITKEKFRVDNKTNIFIVKNHKSRNPAQNTSSNEATLTSPVPNQPENAPRPVANIVKSAFEKETAQNSQNKHFF